MTARLRAAASIASAIAIALGGAEARADSPTDSKAAAEELFVRAKELVAAKDYARACPMFAESLRLDRGVGVMLHLAACYERAGKPASAWAQFREAEQRATLERDARADVARRRADALEPKLYRVTIAVAPTSDVPGLAIERDGIFIERPQWGAAVPIDPGDHRIVATAPDKVRFEATITVPTEKGEATLTIPPLADAAVPQEVAPPARPATPIVDTRPAGADPGRARRIVAIAVAGAGVVSIGIGGYFGLHASSLLGDSNDGGHCRPDNHCDATGASLRHDAQSAGNVSTVLLGVGLAAVAGGAVLYLTAPKRAATKAPAPSIAVRPGGVELRVVF